MRLLVAFDGSEGARAALREAAALSREMGAEVALLRVLNPLTDAADVVAPSTEEAMVVVRQRALDALQDAATSVALDAAQTTFEVVDVERGEDIAEAIERIAAEQSARFIVISSRRAGSFLGAALGSVTSHVIRNAPCPVLVVRE